MRIYRENLKIAATICIVAAVVVAFFAYFRTTLYNMIKVSWNLTIGENRKVCTPEDRLAYLEAHPGVIKFAMLGSWQNCTQTGRPDQDMLGMAIRRINKNGGINGRQIVPEWMDNHESMNELHEYIEKITYDPSYYMIFGPTSTGQLEDIKSLLLTYKLLTIAPRLSNPELIGPEDLPYIFMPCSSDLQDIKQILKWAQEKNRNNFILINEKQPFAEGYSKYLERLFFESDREIVARAHFNTTDNVRYLLEELKNYQTYLQVQNALFVHVSPDPVKSEWLTHWMLANINGGMFSYKVLPGKYTDEELKRIFTTVYFENLNDLHMFVSELSLVPAALNDSYAPLVYRSVFLLADACRQAHSLDYQAVIESMCNKTLNSPFGKFKFDKSRFEKDPKVRILSIYQLRKEWAAMYETYRMKKNKVVQHVPKISDSKQK